MNKYRRCGSDTTLEYTKLGCGKMKVKRNLLRCWHCGVLLCEECYQEHRREVKQEKGDDKK